MEELERNFSESAKKLVSTKTQAREANALYLYGLYKQATEGDCTMEQPWRIQVELYSRWEAWNKNRGMSRRVAMEKYIERVNELT